MIIYLAGPLFSQAEQRFNRELADIMARRGMDVLLPQEDPSQYAESDRPGAIFRSCVSMIERADAVLAVLDGADVDSGTAFEIGYAYASGKPVIGLRTDFRQLEEDGVNIMISRSADIVLSEAGEALERTIERAARALESAVRLEMA